MLWKIIVSLLNIIFCLNLFIKLIYTQFYVSLLLLLNQTNKTQNYNNSMLFSTKLIKQTKTLYAAFGSSRGIWFSIVF